MTRIFSWLSRDRRTGGDDEPDEPGFYALQDAPGGGWTDADADAEPDRARRGTETRSSGGRSGGDPWAERLEQPLLPLRLLALRHCRLLRGLGAGSGGQTGCPAHE